MGNHGGVRISMTLKHKASELDNWHPATSRDMHSTDDLNMALRDTMGSYSPPGVCPIAIRHALLKEKERDQCR
jgi:hypothetical protein